MANRQKLAVIWLLGIIVTHILSGFDGGDAYLAAVVVIFALGRTTDG